MDEEILLGAACPPSRKRKASTTLQPEITQKRNTQKVSPLVVLPLSVVTPEEEDILLQEVWIMFGGPPPKPKTLPDLPIIVDPRQAKVATEFLSLHSVLAVDCEWAYSKDPDAPVRSSELCLIQIGTPEKQVFLFDAYVGGSALFIEGGLKELLENSKIVKVFHDCRWDSDILLSRSTNEWPKQAEGISSGEVLGDTADNIFSRQAGVTLTSVFDTQIGYAVYSHIKTGNYPFPVSLNKTLGKFAGGQINRTKDEARKEMEEDSQYWKKRPFTEVMIQYAKGDVELLPQVHKEMMFHMSLPTTRQAILEFSKLYSEQIKGKTNEELEKKRLEDQNQRDEYDKCLAANANKSNPRITVDRWYPTYGFPEWDKNLKESIERRQRWAGGGMAGVAGVCSFLKKEEEEKAKASSNAALAKK